MSVEFEIMPGDIVKGKVVQISETGQVILQAGVESFQIVNWADEKDVYLAWTDEETSETKRFPKNTAFKVYCRTQKAVSILNSADYSSSPYYFHRFRAANQSEIEKFKVEENERIRAKEVEENKRLEQIALEKEAEKFEELKAEVAKLTSISKVTELLIATQNHCIKLANAIENK